MTSPPEGPVDPAHEIVDLYDEVGSVIGQAPRSRVRAQNLRHAATGIVVRNRVGEIFVHRRTDTKDVYPGLYDLAAGGVVSAGEDPAESAGREVFEELGVHGVPLESLRVSGYEDEHTRYVAFLYTCVYDGPIRLQPQEVAWGDWLAPHDVLARLQDPAWPFVPDTVALLREDVRRWAAPG